MNNQIKDQALLKKICSQLGRVRYYTDNIIYPKLDGNILTEKMFAGLLELSEADKGIVFLYDKEGQPSVEFIHNMRYEEILQGDPSPAKLVNQVLNMKETGESQFMVLSDNKLCITLKPDYLVFNKQVSEKRQHSGSFYFPFGIMYCEKQKHEVFHEQDIRRLTNIASKIFGSVFPLLDLYLKTTIDNLTGFVRRDCFEHLLVSEIREAGENNAPLSLLMIDIDNFEEVNVTYGLDIGDKALKELGETIRRVIRGKDIATRYGGDEFAVILPTTDQAGAELVSKKIIHKLGETRFLDGLIKFSVCIGSCSFPDNALDFLDLIKRADQALSSATGQGAGSYQAWHENITDSFYRVDRLYGLFSGNPSKDYVNISALLNTINAISFVDGLDEHLSLIIKQVIKITASDRGAVFLVDDNDRLFAKIAKDKHGNDIKLILGEDIPYAIPDKVVRTGTPLYFVKDSPQNAQFGLQDQPLGTIISIPLHMKGKRIGAIYADSKLSNLHFAKADLAFLEALTTEAAQVIERAQLVSEKQETERRLRIKLEAENKQLKEIIAEEKKVVGQSKAFQTLLEKTQKVAPTDATIVIYGESGTGKELLAKMVHKLSTRKNGPFIVVDSTAIPGHLLESELFGHEKGAFTDAHKTKIGKFELADNGTIFLDEISELPLLLQAKLLRTIQERSVQRIGGKDWIKTDFRIVAATNKDLSIMVEQGNFRQDLYFRLNVIPLLLPPLRERKEDILLL
ncbi:MAG: sigma 54-interacting transcriptional regulator, partial [Pseudomonadota bacterium]